ncbi:MAG: hypothetical protein NZZ41_06125 [Candidatus Dojkabacteria bacterium]|nr:hypothetical protein [Candidatus Dojkabacteria bacterium]
MKPIDLSKFRKEITKNIPGISVGFKDPETWIHTGNYALNYIISGNFFRGVPLGKVTMFAGQSGSGKSFLCSGNIVRNAQKMGIYVVLIDTEAALDREWLERLGVDTSEEKLLKINMSMIDDVAKLISDFMKNYKNQYEGVQKEERPKVLFVIDSLGMLTTPSDISQFESGDLKGDMGRKPKALAALVRNCVNVFAEHEIGLICTNHTYASQNIFEPDDVISGGQGPVYASSIVVAMRKLKLKEDEEGNKTTEIQGIRSQCKVMKSRFSKPFESIEIKIPWSKGIDPYSGLVDLFETKGILTKEGHRLTVKLSNGEELKYYRKDWEKNEEDCLMKVMKDWKNIV